MTSLAIQNPETSISRHARRARRTAMASPPAHGGSFRVVRTARVAPSSPAAGAGCNPQPEATLPLTLAR
uniref:Uncharacterized protein n=1 Tax=Oryza sativa subsp. japonica TaxID=39947 RepID=Q6K6U0_ORYSJ|nr:hypothetical protein [Oryza sativa Japonica Group]BAD21956.1 hypothetical protein [Oryza sativa Japonica Group]